MSSDLIASQFKELSVRKNDRGELRVRVDNFEKLKNHFATKDAPSILSVVDNILIVLAEFYDEPNTLEGRLLASVRFIGRQRPQDSIEQALIVQMVITNILLLENYFRGSVKKFQSNHMKEGIKLSRLYLSQMDSFSRYRNRGKQNVTVKHIHVNNGAQAIIGDINKAVKK